MFAEIGINGQVSVAKLLQSFTALQGVTPYSSRHPAYALINALA